MQAGTQQFPVAIWCYPNELFEQPVEVGRLVHSDLICDFFDQKRTVTEQFQGMGDLSEIDPENRGMP